MKISYIIPTIKPEYCANYVIHNIEHLPKHDFEIILISPNPSKFSGKNIISLFDDTIAGAVYSFNKGYKVSTGDIIVPFCDDQELCPNFLDIFNYIETPEFQNKKIKLCNLAERMGGPGKDSYHKLEAIKEIKNPWPLDSIFPQNHPNKRPYTTYFFPLIMRESIEKYMDGVIYNDCFVQGWNDHWIGYYSDILNNDSEMGPKNIYSKTIDSFNNIKSPAIAFHNQDRDVFFKLVELSSHGIKYNHKI